MTPYSKRYLRGILKTLMVHSGSSMTFPEITIIKSAQPVAFVVHHRLIALSSGMVHSLHNEGELYFIIAHELAHLLLGHLGSSTHALEAQENLEIDADNTGIKLLARASLPGAINAVSLLLRLHRHSEGYPHLDARIKAIHNALGSHQIHHGHAKASAQFKRFQQTIRLRAS